MVDCLNACGVQYVCFGNHENDIPWPELLDRIKESKFLWVNSNLKTNFGSVSPDKLPQTTSFTVKGGGQSRTVTLLGLLTHDPSIYRKGAFADGKIEPILECTDRLLSTIDREKVDLILPMTHQRMPVSL
jgi:2',3'-cyclic-nucleotide 2'-phosphodiesterase (5'-nucleotidase family)